MKEAFVAIDVKRRRFLAVERAEAFICRAGLLQRDVILDDDDDIGLVLQVVDETLRE